MVLMVDTTEKHIGKVIAEEVFQSVGNAAEFELIDSRNYSGGERHPF